MSGLVRLQPVIGLLLIGIVFASPAAACCYCAAGECAAPTDGQANFTLQGGQWLQPGGDGTPLTVTYSYNNFLDGGLKDPDGVTVSAGYLRLVTEEAFGLWAAVAPIHFVEVTDVGTPVYTNNQPSYLAFPSDSFGQIRISHRFINGTDAQNGRPTTKALAYFPSNGDYIGGDIHFDNGDPWAVVGTSSEPDVLGIMTHEIGHTLGIGHSTVAGSVMFPAALRRMGPGTGTLTPDDVAAVRAIYGEGVGSVSPLLPIPEPATLVLLAAITASWLGGRRVRG